MPNNDMITLRNKRTGEVVTVPRSQYRIDEPTTGVVGMAQDIGKSIGDAPGAAMEMISSIPGGIKNVSKYASTHNPVSTLGNLGAGGVESAAGLLSSPQVLIRYLAEKFPELGKRMAANPGIKGTSYKDPTFYESLNKFENDHGLAPQSEQESSVRNAGGLLFGGKALTGLPNILSRTGALSAENAGRGGDPVHAAILGLIGEGSARLLNKNKPSMETIKSAPQAALETIKSIPEKAKNMAAAAPEVLGSSVASALESAADYGSKIPMAGEVLQPTVGAIAAYLKHKSVKPEDLAKRKLFGDIAPNQLDQINERMAAAKRLGLSYLTPAEATVSPFEAAKQGTVGRTSTGSKLLFEKGAERSGTEHTAINSLLDSIHNEKELAPKMKEAYEETMTGTVPPDFIETHSQRPVIEAAIKKLENNPSYRQLIEEERGTKLDEVSPNTFRYWDIVKRVLGDMEEDKKDKMGRATTESSVMGKSRRQMVSDMDKIKPEYETARNISERMHTRRKIEDFFDKRAMTGNNLDKFLSSKKNWAELQHKLSPFPDALEKLNDLHLLSKDLIPNNMSLRAATALKRTGMSESRNKLDALKADLDERYGREHDVATVKLMTDPDWQAVLTEYLKKKGNK